MNTLPVGATFMLSVALYSTGALVSLANWRKPALCRYICCGQYSRFFKARRFAGRSLQEFHCLRTASTTMLSLASST